MIKKYGFRYAFMATLTASTLALSTVGLSLAPTTGHASMSSPVSAMPAGDMLSQLIKSISNYENNLNPLYKAKHGDEDSRGKLQDMSAEAEEAKREHYERYIMQMKMIDRGELEVSEQLSYDILLANLEQSLNAIHFRTYEMPLTSEWGFHMSMASLNQWVSLKTYEDYQDYLKLLAGVPRYFEQSIDNMKQGMKRNFTVPKAVLAGYSDSIKVYIKDDATQTSWYAPFNQLPEHFTEKQKKSLQKQGAKVIRKKVIPAYEDYLEFFEEDYFPNAKPTIAATDYPDGDAFYQSEIKKYTTLDLTADEIHAIGWKEVKRIRAEMEQVIEESGFEGSFAEFLDFLRTDEQFYAKTPEELLKEAAYISKKMDHQLPKFFKKLPRQPYGVVAVAPEIAPKYTTGRYSGAPLDSTRAGEYWVNTYALDKRPLYNLEALTLHEAVPGHHLQTALAKELTDLPEFRQNTYISAFGEGWGLYSERLGLEAGFYKDPYSNFGRLTYEMWRAMRLVVDTGMHAKGMTRDEAIDLMESNTALSTLNVRTEIDRYISWPAQALSYKLGEIKIRELRARAEKELGQDFDIRDFHDAVLANGSIPLSALEQQIDSFIESTKPELKKAEK